MIHRAIWDSRLGHVGQTSRLGRPRTGPYSPGKPTEEAVLQHSIEGLDNQIIAHIKLRIGDWRLLDGGTESDDPIEADVSTNSIKVHEATDSIEMGYL